MNCSPTISVVMPVYNAERYVAEAVESILAQTFIDFEFLIVDDGSTDRSLEILQSYASKDPRIRLHSRPNTGLVVALNEMLSEARGEFIARMDADDIAFEKRFETQLAVFAENSALVLLGSHVEIIDEDGDPLRRPPLPTSHAELEDALVRGKGQLLFHPSVMMRREQVALSGGYRQETWPVEDLDLFLRLAEVGQIGNDGSVLLKYREHHKKIGRVYNRLQFEKIQTTLQQAQERRGIRVSVERTTPPVGSRALSHRVWAWWALGAGNTRTARKHAFRALAYEPFAAENWRVAYCSLRGR